MTKREREELAAFALVLLLVGLVLLDQGLNDARDGQAHAEHHVR